MIDRQIHDKRASAVYSQMQSRFGEKKWKGGRRAGTVRVPKIPLPFTRNDFRDWCWARLGLQATPCPYCGAPIDILNASIDHVIPVSRGGQVDLCNLMPICRECNAAKGAFTGAEYRRLLDVLDGPENAFLRQELLKRLKDASNAPRERVFRKKKATA